MTEIPEVDVGVCRASYYDADGFLVHAPDAIGGREEDAGLPEYALEHGGPGGFEHRALDPEMAGDDVDPEKCCSCALAWHGGKCFTHPLKDPRFLRQLDPLEQGESRIYGGSASMVSVVLVAHDGKVKAGTQGQTVATVRAPELLQWMEGLEGILATMGAATIPPTAAAVNAWKTAMAPIKEALKALLVEVT